MFYNELMKCSNESFEMNFWKWTLDILNLCHLNHLLSELAIRNVNIKLDLWTTYFLIHLIIWTPVIEFTFQNSVFHTYEIWTFDIELMIYELS